MERQKSVQGKRPIKGKGPIAPPVEIFALGSKQSRSSSESNLQKLVSISSGADKKLGTLGKRESTSLLPTAPVVKKPKVLTQGQTFTPLGRPAEREADRRASPAPTITAAYEELAIEVEGLSLLKEVLGAEDVCDDERVEGLLCGAVKHLHTSRAKPEPAVYLTLMYLAREKPVIFHSEVIIEAFCSLLKRDMSLNFKSKGNPLVSVLACNILMQSYSQEENWPDDFVKVYVDDALGERVWVDRPDCKGLVDNIITAFHTNLPKSGISGLDIVKTEPGSASPSVSSFDDDDKGGDVDMEKSTSGHAEQQNVHVFPRFPYQSDNIESYVMDIIRDQMLKRQLMDASAKSLIRLITATCGYDEVRHLASQKLELWLQNPKLMRSAQELLMAICMNCSQSATTDIEVIVLIIKIRMKTKPLLNHYLNCIRELLGQNSDNLRMVLSHTIFNELSTTRNPNNMSLIGVIFQTQPEKAARVLAEIFQDLTANKDDYSRALRALFREIVRSLRHDINLTAYCVGLMQERTEPKFTDMEPQFKERYIMAVTDLVTLCVLQAITPSLREAVSSIAKGDKKDIELLYNYQNQVAEIQRDAVWWLHTVVPKFIECKATEYAFYMKKVLFMESAEHYCKDNWPAESDRGSMIRLATECPILEDTLMRVLVIGLSRDLPFNPSDAIDFADILVKRAANLQAEGRQVIYIERLGLIDALLNLCTYRHPENIALPTDYTPPSLAISNLYWKAWSILLLICAFNPSTFGLAAWENYPTLKCMIEMVMTSNYKFPPPTTATDENQVDEFRNKEIQVAQQEKQLILEFESHLAASTTITEANSLLIAQLTTMDPSGVARRPPQIVLDQLRTMNDNLKVGQMLCRSRNPDFLLHIIQRQGTSQSMPWLAELVESSEGSLDVLPVQCLCEFLLHETQDLPKENLDDESAKFDRQRRRQKLRKQQQLLSRLQSLVHGATTDSTTVHEVMDYFLKRLASTQAANRSLAIKGLSMILSKSKMSPEEEEPMDMDSDSGDRHRHAWLLTHLPALPMFPDVREKTCLAIRQACQIETEPSLISAFLIFLSEHTLDHSLQASDELALDMAQLIVERTTVINYILPAETGPRSRSSMETLGALITLFVNYLCKAKEPDTAGYSWSNTQDQIILQWESGESATMHILVVHAMIILLTYGQANNRAMYEQLLETWFPDKTKLPSAFLLDTSEEALLLPDWLKLRMIRCNTEQLVRAALQDLEPSQLLLFVQSFGIPIHSMSKLLLCLDNSVVVDPVGLEQSVVDKAYMAQLIEVQHLRGATGGAKFYFMLTDGGDLDAHKGDEDMNTTPSDSAIWRVQGHQDGSPEMVPASHVVNTLLQAFDPSGRKSPDAETHYRFLIMSVQKQPSATLDLVKGLHKILAGASGSEFARSLHHSTKACSLMKLLISKQNEAGVMMCLGQMMEQLARFSGGQKCPMSAIIHQYITSQGRQKHKQAATRPQLTLGNDKQFIEDLQTLSSGDSTKLESLVGRCMRDAMATKGSAAGARAACVALVEQQQGLAEHAMLPSTAGLFIDWLEQLDPAVIRLVPEIQDKLLFARQTVSQAGGRRKNSSQPYLLALLTHQSGWAALHRCIGTLLHHGKDKCYDPVSVLDFLWACIHIPKIWQGRERKIAKNQEPEDVLGLHDDQLTSLVDFIIDEATSLLPAGPATPTLVSTKDAPVTIGSRMQLLKACICDQDHRVKLIGNYVETKLKKKSGPASLYHALLLEMYLQYPYLMSWLDDSQLINSDTTPTTLTDYTQMDMISHRLLMGLNQGKKNRKNDSRMLDINIALRKMAAQHPLLLLRQLEMIVPLLKGKTQFTFGEFRQRNYMSLYTFILGILELLVPRIFAKEFTALEDILEEYFTLIKTYGCDFKQLGPIIVKFISFLNQFVNHDSHRATTQLQKHVVVLGHISNLYPDLVILKSLLAGLTLPRHSQEETTSSSGDSTPVIFTARSASPWSMSHLAPFIQRIKKDNSEDVLAVLQDLDETSKRKLEILEHFLGDLRRLMTSLNDPCRNTAYELVKRYIRQNPMQACDFVPSYLHCLESSNPDVVNSALTNLAEFTIMCQDYSEAILQKAFSVGITSSIDTSTYISESLQLLNLDLSTT